MSWITVRYFNASGADAESEIGEKHDPETHLIPIALAVAAGHRDQMKIFGTDYDTPDGTCIRDYIHVSDIAQAHLCGFKAFENGLMSTEVNIGTGVGVSNLEILKMIENVTGYKVSYEAAPRREGDLKMLYADPTRAIEVLGFKAKHSDLNNIIQTAWQFYSNVYSQ